MVATGAVALTAPFAAANAQIQPFSFGFPPTGSTVATGTTIPGGGCVGSYNPSLGGENGSASAQTCGAILALTGPEIGQISSVIGPTMIGSPGSIVVVSAGPVSTVP
jgi:hypothetical protein